MHGWNEHQWHTMLNNDFLKDHVSNSPHQTLEAYRTVLDNVFHTYNQAGFQITTIHCDNEFRPLMNQLQDTYNVQMN
jgi:hypothetical protein